MPNDLRTYIQTLESNYPEEIIRIENGPLDPARGECAALLYHLLKRGKKPLAVFSNVKNLWGRRWEGSVAFQLAASWKKVGIGYGLAFPNASLLDIEILTSQRTKKAIAPIVIDTSKAPVKARVLRDRINFFDLPGYTAAEKDHRPGNLAGVVVIRDPDTKRYNLSWHMDHIIEPERSTIALHGGGRHAADIVKKYRERGEAWVPMAQVFGHHVLFGLTAATRAGLDVDEVELAGGLFGEPLRMVPSETWGEELLVPADAEVVIEGYISTKETARRGLWSDAMRYYVPAKEAPILKLAAINMREDPIFEHNWVGYYVYAHIATCSFIRSMLASRFPGVRAVNYIAPAVLAIQFKPRQVGDVRRLAGLAHAYGENVKHIIVVDEDVDVFDPGMVWWSIGTRVDASKKVYIVDGLSPSRIDPSAEEAIEAGATVGGLVIDSTKPIGKPFAEVGYPAEEVLKQIQLLDYVSKEKVDKLAVASSYIGSA